MHDRLNGHSTWPPPSRSDILLEELRRDMHLLNAKADRAHQEMAELRGETRQGMQTLAANDRELFAQNRDIRDRLTRNEMRPPSGPPPTAPAGSRRLMRWPRSLPAPWEVVLCLLILAVAFGLVPPERAPMLKNVLSDVKLSGR